MLLLVSCLVECDLNLRNLILTTDAVLQLNDDDSMVKRSTPVPEARNVDAETVYVVFVTFLVLI